MRPLSLRRLELFSMDRVPYNATEISCLRRSDCNNTSLCNYPYWAACIIPVNALYPIPNQNLCALLKDNECPYFYDILDTLERSVSQSLWGKLGERRIPVRDWS